MLTQLFYFLARHARALLAIGVFIGIVAPPLASSLKPLVTPAVIGTLTAALLRLDWQKILNQARQPSLILRISFLQLILAPLLVWLVAALIGLPSTLCLIIILQAAAPPIGSAPVFALLLGLDATLSVLITVTTILLLPLTLTPLVAALPDNTIEIDLLVFFLRVTTLVLTPFLLAWLLRWLLGLDRLERNDHILAGINVILLVVFAIGVMDGVTERFILNPHDIIVFFVLAWVMAILLHIGGWLSFASSGFNTALSAAVCSGNRNMGLMLAITAGTAGVEFSLYVGIAQIPMYFMPLIMSFCLSRFFNKG